MINPIAIEKNALFAAFAPQSQMRLSHMAELVLLERDTILHEPMHALSHVYFPIDAIVAMIYVVESGALSEVSVIGKEGLVGALPLLTGESLSCQALVMSAGYAFRMPKESLLAEYDEYHMLKLLMRYVQTLMLQTSLTAVCNRHHSIEQQLCRFLLMCLDRLPCNHLTMTQELIASMLGVRREGVTEAAGKLQHLGVIHYCRGHITVLERDQLEQRCCECYQVVKRETDRLLAPMGAVHLSGPDTHAPASVAKCSSCFKATGFKQLSN